MEREEKGSCMGKVVVVGAVCREKGSGSGGDWNASQSSGMGPSLFRNVCSARLKNARTLISRKHFHLGPRETECPSGQNPFFIVPKRVKPFFFPLLIRLSFLERCLIRCNVYLSGPRSKLRHVEYRISGTLRG